MRNKVAKPLRRYAEKSTVGESKAKTDTLYKGLKSAHKKQNSKRRTLSMANLKKA